MAIEVEPRLNPPRPPEILVVEDEAIVALELQRTLKRLGYRAERSAATAEEALLLIEKHDPDLVLMDIVLAGGMKGTEAAKLVNARFHVPVLYVTAHSDPATLEEIKATDEHGLLTKPFQPKQLHAAIELALARYRKDRERSAARQRALEQDAQEHVQQFTYAAGHDLQEPLRTAVSFMELLAKRAGSKLNEDERHLLNEARAGLARMGTLLQDLLAYARDW